jgi:DNA-binding winged helix-turn-helix (wHTH) protein
MKLQFGDSVLDTEARQVLRGGRDIHLSPKAFELLCLLVERRPTALSKADLHEHIWPATFVSDDSLAKLITEIRHGIGDDARDARLVRTVHGFGYAFTDAVAEIRGTALVEAVGLRCWLQWEGRELLIQKPRTIIGRDPGVDVQLESPRISRQHAQVIIDGLKALIEDLGSKNGTFLRDERITMPTPLTHGDEIRVGPFVLTFRQLSLSPTTESEIDSA